VTEGAPLEAARAAPIHGAEDQRAGKAKERGRERAATALRERQGIQPEQGDEEVGHPHERELQAELPDEAGGKPDPRGEVIVEQSAQSRARHIGPQVERRWIPARQEELGPFDPQAE